MVKNQRQRILVAMSGGVDSSAAALILKNQGYSCVGVTMKLFCYAQTETSPKSCCSLDAINDAKAVCKKIGITHYVLNYEKEFEEEVIEDFIKEYEKGRTPNPCIRCNQFIKFDHLLKKAEELGCDYLATGHYAQINQATNNNQQITFKLLRGVDKVKDQTYFLYRLNQKQLSKLKFPLGELTKKEVREITKEAGLKTAEKAESQEICFIDASVPVFLSNKIKMRKGDIVDISGNKVGEHEGIPFYTVGQRKGLGGGFKEPKYVIGINPQKNTVIVGSGKDLYEKEVLFRDVSWISGEAPEKKDLSAMIRYNMAKEKLSELKKNDNQYEAVFEDKVRAVTPGQSIVFYSGDECLGGGIISSS